MLVSGAPLPGLPGFEGAAAYAALAEYAATLHRRAGLDGPPYDPLRIAQALGVRVRFAPTAAGTHGVLVPLRDGAYAMLVRASEVPGAQRFTMAHELVELGLQVGCPALVERSYHNLGASRTKERFCEAGAAEILMPLARVRREWQARAEGVAALLELAGLFGTSLQAMLWRLVEVAERPCVGVLACAGGSDAAGPGAPSLPEAWTEEPRAAAGAAAGWLRVRAARGGGGLRTRVPPGTGIPPESVLARCYQACAALQATEDLALGGLRGRFTVDAICPGRGEGRHVYALLHPC
jgi:hypothetical protein